MINDLRNAFAFLTTLPVGYTDTARPGRAFAYYPLIGLAIGCLLGLTGYLAGLFFTSSVAAFLVLVEWVVITGGLHLDGFGDACDGLLSAVSPERRLEIMKDSRAGSWAVVGLVLLLLGKWTAIQSVSPLSLVLPPVLGRWAIVMVVYLFPYARTSGIGAHFRSGFTRQYFVVATVSALALTLVLTIVVDYRIALTILITPMIAWGAGKWASRRLGGGLTGDVYGAICEFVELVVLFML